MICPNCQTEVEVTEQHYGALFTCPSCQAVYFINFDGKPEFGDVEVPADINFGGPAADVPPAQESAPPAEVASQVQDYNNTDLNNGSGFEASLEPLVDSVDMVAFDNKLDDQFNNLDNSLNNDFNTPMDNSYESPIGDVSGSEPQPTSEEVQQATESQSAEQPMPDTDFSNTDANPFEAMAASPELAAKPAASAKKNNSFSDAAKEISAYGNTEVQLAGLNYDLKIVGLDTQETMKLFKEAIEDSKFGWDVNELMKTVKNGEIQFSRLSPVKAYILAKRIQFLDIEKQWKQNVLS
ncbi:hypothetical protein K2P97_08040 [bacterium]|nr:hypothetical protein [bacterium]